jgi:hypothetical protein
MALPESDQVWIIRVTDAEKMSLDEFSTCVAKHINEKRQHQSKELNTSYDWVVNYVPNGLVRQLLSFFTKVETDWGLNLSWLGVPQREPFQPCSTAITSVGSLGIDEGSPTFPVAMQPCPMIVSLGAVKKTPWVAENGQDIVVRDVMSCVAAGDHRVIDGKLASLLLAALRKYVDAFANGQPVGTLLRAKL